MDIKVEEEKMTVTTGVSLSETMEQLNEHWRISGDKVSGTFPILATPKENKVHSKRYLGQEEGIFYYANYPWQITRFI